MYRAPAVCQGQNWVWGEKGDPDAPSLQAAGRYSQWGMGSIPDPGARIPHAAQHGKKKIKINRFVEGREKGKEGRKEGGREG